VPLETPLKSNWSFTVFCMANLAEKGSVAKISGKEGERFEGPAKSI